MEVRCEIVYDGPYCRWEYWVGSRRLAKAPLWYHTEEEAHAAFDEFVRVVIKGEL